MITYRLCTALIIAFFPATILADGLNCTRGQFLSPTTNACANCSANTYCPQGGVVSQCPPFTVSPPGSWSLAQCACPANAALSNGVCMCASGYLMSASGLQCTPCPANAFCPDQNTVRNCSNNALSLPGQWSPTGCNACPVGYVQNSQGTAPISCRPCTLGYACPNISTEIMCPAGTFAPSLATACTQCPANTYAVAASSACTPCTANSYSKPGSQSVDACLCGDGYFIDFYLQCLPCSPGYACQNENANNGAVACPAGTYSPGLAASCLPCNVGTYQDTVASSTCKTCPAGLTVLQSKQASDGPSVQARSILTDGSQNGVYISLNPIFNGQGYNVTGWSFWANGAGCAVTPVLFSGQADASGNLMFQTILAGTRRNTTSAGAQTYAFADSGSQYRVPITASSSTVNTYFGWYFSGPTCIPHTQAPPPPTGSSTTSGYNFYVQAFAGPYNNAVKYGPTSIIYSNSPNSNNALWSVQVLSTLTEINPATANVGTTNISQCFCPDGTRQLSNGLCQNKCPNGQYIAALGDTQCSPCAQGSYCINSLILPCPPNTGSMPGATACTPCINPGASTNIQLYTCGMLPTCTLAQTTDCCTPNAPINIGATTWMGLGQISVGTGNTGSTPPTPWSPGATILGLVLNPASDRPFALIQTDVELYSPDPGSDLTNHQIAVQFYYRCMGVACPDWMAVYYSADSDQNFILVLNITTFSPSGGWVQIATTFFAVSTTEVPTTFRLTAQMTLNSCILWVGNFELVDLGFWNPLSTYTLQLLTTDTVKVPRYPWPGKYMEPVPATNLLIGNDQVSVMLPPGPPLFYNTNFNYVVSLYASGAGNLTIQTSNADIHTWPVASVEQQYKFITTANPTMFAITAEGTIVVEAPSLLLRSAVVGCQTCLANYYCDQMQITPCIDNSVSPAGSNQLTQCVCVPGYYGQPGVIVDIFTNALDTCKPCPQGYYCPGGAQAIVCPNGTITNTTGMSSCTICAADEYCAFGTMHGCPPNSDSPADSHDISQCICNPGYYGVAPNCQMCEPGFYCMHGVKTACTAHATSPVMSFNESACYCSPGYYGLHNTPCAPCQSYAYCTGGLNISCPNNMWSPVLSSIVSNCSCDFGYYAVQASCVGCSAGSYKTYRGQGVCTTCSSGTYSTGRAATSSAACLSCAPGTFSISSGQYQCQACAAGTYASGLASSTCAQCWGGAYSTMGASGCTLCTAGTYSSAVGATALSTCKTCAEGSWAYANSTACSICGACSYWAYPPAVHFNVGASTTLVSNTAQQHYSFAFNSYDGRLYMAMGLSIYTIDLNTGTISNALTLQSPDTRQWWYYSISTSILGNYIYAVQDQNVFRYDLGMSAYDIIYSSKLATCAVEDSTQPQVVLWIVQPTMIRQVDPTAAVDLNDYAISGAVYACVNPQDPLNLFVTGSFGLKRMNKATGAFTTLKSGAAYGACQVTPDGNFVVMAQTAPAPKIVAVYSLFDGTLTTLQSLIPVSGLFVDSANVVLGGDLVGIRNVSYTYFDTRNCPPGAYGEMGGMTTPNQCSICIAGNLCPGGPNVTACLPGYYSNLTGLREQAQCMACPAGMFCPIAACNETLGTCSFNTDTGLCTGAGCDTRQGPYTCPAGTYSIDEYLFEAQQCPLCQAGFYCPNPLQQLPCPNNTWAPQGSQDLSNCACAPGYRCIITKVVHAEVVLNMLQSQFNGNTEQLYKAAVAAAAGVPVSQVSIQGVFSVTTPPSGRRLLAQRKRRWSDVAVEVHTIIRMDRLADLATLNTQLKKRGIPPHRGVRVSLHQEVVEALPH